MSLSLVKFTCTWLSNWLLLLVTLCYTWHLFCFFFVNWQYPRVVTLSYITDWSFIDKWYFLANFCEIVWTWTLMPSTWLWNVLTFLFLNYYVIEVLIVFHSDTQVFSHLWFSHIVCLLTRLFVALWILIHKLSLLLLKCFDNLVRRSSSCDFYMSIIIEVYDFKKWYRNIAFYIWVVWLFGSWLSWRWLFVFFFKILYAHLGLLLWRVFSQTIVVVRVCMHWRLRYNSTSSSCISFHQITLITERLFSGLKSIS